MTPYSVVIDHLPVSTEMHFEYMQRLREAFPEAEEVLVPWSVDEEFYGLDGPSLHEWLQSLGLTPVETAGNGWARLNQTVSTASTKLIFVLEEDWWPVNGLARAVIPDESDNWRGVKYLCRRDANLHDAINSSIDRFARSSARTQSNPGYAYLIDKRTFLEVRGYDETPAAGEVASLDFATRLHRANVACTQHRTAEFAVYHAKEACSSPNVDGVRSKTSRVELLKAAESDKTIYRNLVEWSVDPAKRVPLVCVAIATKDRGDLLQDSLNSVLFQTFQDFEILVIDDGSMDSAAEDAVRNIGDTRIAYVRQEAAGISAARNLAADTTDCLLTAVHDDDDIMLPDRLERGLAALTAEYDASYGSWINFAHETGEMQGFLGKLGFGADLNAFSGQGPGHATWTLPTRYIRSVRYDERLTASVDHNLATRLDWIGVKWVHTEKYMYLRRVHDRQVTSTDGAGQKFGHALGRYANTFLSSREQRSEMRARGKALKFPTLPKNADLQNHFAGYLPDRLVRRTVTIFRSTQTSMFDADMPDRMLYMLEDRDLQTGVAHYDGSALSPVSLADLAKLRAAGIIGASVSAEIVADPEPIQQIEDDVVMEDPDSSEDTDSRVQKAVLNASIKRLEFVASTHFRRLPDGGIVIVEDAEPYVRIPDNGLLEGSVLARRILGVGEFGLKVSYRMYGYKDFTTALDRALRHHSADPFQRLHVLTTGLRDVRSEALGIASESAVRDNWSPNAS